MSDHEFYRGKYDSITLEGFLQGCKTFDEFEKRCSENLLKRDLAPLYRE